MARALVFAHYDKHGIVDDHVLYSLAVYRQYFQVVHFVTTSVLDPVQMARVAGLVDRVVVRANIGYDFMSWRVGFECLPHHLHFDEIVFANDSCYGPVSDMGAFWQRVGALDADLWGASMNHQFRPHVQSFFMGFGRRLIASGFARRFWQGVEVIPDKLQLIFAYEVGLSARVEEEGFRIGGVAALPKIGKPLRKRLIADNAPPHQASPEDAALAGKASAYIRAEQFLNPVHLGWAEALRLGLPFVKVELLRDNPLHANLQRVHATLKRETRYDLQLIARHLARTAGAGSFPLAQAHGGMRRIETPAAA